LDIACGGVPLLPRMKRINVLRYVHGEHADEKDPAQGEYATEMRAATQEPRGAENERPNDNDPDYIRSKCAHRYIIAFGATTQTSSLQRRA